MPLTTKSITTLSALHLALGRARTRLYAGQHAHTDVPGRGEPTWTVALLRDDLLLTQCVVESLLDDAGVAPPVLPRLLRAGKMQDDDLGEDEDDDDDE